MGILTPKGMEVGNVKHQNSEDFRGGRGGLLYSDNIGK